MKEYELDEDRGHIVWFAEYGNPDGPAILSFHGGPGSQSRIHHAQRFDLTKYRIILFDQRGCGKSTPRGELSHNSTQDILSDAERIRERLGITTWFVSGGSWGSTLALLYAIQHKEHVRGILISAVFLANRDSTMWAMSDPKGVARIMPDNWARRMAFFKRFNIALDTQNADLLKAFEGASLETQKEITAEVQDWEGNLFSVHSSVSYRSPADISENDIASVKIFLFYEQNHEFIAENHILDSIGIIADVPAVIVHGRYDILCPLENAYKLKEELKECELVIATSSGHKLTAEGETIQKMAYAHFLEKHT